LETNEDGQIASIYIKDDEREVESDRVVKDGKRDNE
jgi:hypothetical protein